MKLHNPDLDFVIIGENIHTTRVVMRRGKLVTTTGDGREAVRYRSVDGERRHLVIPEAVEGTQDSRKDASSTSRSPCRQRWAATESPAEGMHYLRRMVQRAGTGGRRFPRSQGR